MQKNHFFSQNFDHVRERRGERREGKKNPTATI